MIKTFGLAGEDVCDMDQAAYIFALRDKMIMIEGRRVQTYGELVQLASQDKYRDKEYLEVTLLPTVVGG